MRSPDDLPGPTGAAIFHLHPLSRCNLECGHCYSDSSPRATAVLSRDQACGAVLQAAAWGYRRLAISGGEPLLYPWLDEVVALGTDCCMQTSLITNGLLVSHKDHLATLRHIGAVAVSVDGLATSHNALRNHPRAFSGALGSLATLRDAGIDFSVVCGVGKHNLHEIDALAELACQAGASALQLHPLTLSGRGAALADALLDEHGANLLYLAGLLLAGRYQGRLGVHVDLLHRRSVLARPSLIYAGDDNGDDDAFPASLLGVLVLEPDGTLNPLCYGFAPGYRLGNIHQQPIDALWRPWRRHGYARLLGLGRRVFDGLRQGEGPSLFNPSDLLRRAAQREPHSLTVYHHQ